MDYFGKRLATCSSDRTVKIFEVSEDQQTLVATLTGYIYIMIVSLMWLLNLLCSHEGPVWQVAWAHPKYGSILASCSYDRKVHFNISICAVTHSLHQRLSSGRKPVERGSSCMSFASTNHQVKAQENFLEYSRYTRTLSVNSIQWAPHEWGLLLACGSSDESISFISTSGNIY